MSSGPDFLCIGMQKAGTGWLYDQLQHHPSFWMPPIKELHYFDRGYPDLRMLETIQKRKESPRTVDEGWRPLTPADEGFFKVARSAFLNPMDLERYAALFDFKGLSITGDITPAYCSLEEEVIRGIANRFPGLKVMLIIRDPVSRLWSQIAMNDRRGKFDLKLLEDAPGLVRHVSKRSIASRSFATDVVDRWSRYFPPEHFKIVIFDDIVASPDETRADIIRFLGGDASFQGPVTADFNRKESLPKVAISDTARTALAEYLRDELIECRSRFGGHCAGWCEAYGIA